MGCQPAPNSPITIRPNSDVNVIVDVLDTPTNKPHPIPANEFQGATGYFLNTDNTTLAVSGGVWSADRGQLNFPLTRVMTAALAQGDAQSLEVWFDQNSIRSVLQFNGLLNIPAPLINGL